MASLKTRFPVYSKLLKLYPKSYYRKYQAQLLQTLADMLDDATEGSQKKSTIWQRTAIDFVKSVPREHIRAVNPRRFITKSLMLSLLLVMPIILSVGFTILFPASDPIAERTLIEQLWFSQIGYSLWAIALPFFATILAITALVVWRFHRPKDKSRKKRHSLRVALVGLSLVSLAGVTFLGFIGTMWIKSNQKLSREVADSRRTQAENPTLACSLLPEQAAKAILGKSTYLHNNINGPEGPFNGSVMDDQKTQSTTCQYHADPSAHNILIVNASYGKTPDATEEMKKQFFDRLSSVQSISLQNYQGSYHIGQGTFSLELWVKDYHLGIVAESFEQASQAMSEMIKNLEKRIATPKPDMSDKLPTKLEDLSKLDQKALAEAVQNKELSIPAGTTYNVDMQEISSDKVMGTVQYGNGTKGKFSAEKRNGIWQVVEYKRL